MVDIKHHIRAIAATENQVIPTTKNQVIPTTRNQVIPTTKNPVIYPVKEFMHPDSEVIAIVGEQIGYTLLTIGHQVTIGKFSSST
jgi:hypothetical protein